MLGKNAHDLMAFLAVARERSFTRAAAQLGVSQSALSHAIRGLEERLGLRLLTRTTRSVAPTEAGARLLRIAGPKFDQIDIELGCPNGATGKARRHYQDHSRRACGSRGVMACPDEAAAALPGHQGGDDYRLRPHRHCRRAIRRGRSLGEQVAKDMVAVRIGPDFCMAVVGAPSYFETRPKPKETAGPYGARLHQYSLADLRRNIRLGVREARSRNEGAGRRATGVQQPRIEDERGAGGSGPRLSAGGQVEKHTVDGKLVRVLDDWCAPFSGYHLYYPSRRHSSPAFSLLVEALRYRK